MFAEPFQQSTVSPSARGAGSQFEVGAARMLATFLLWHARGRQRRALARLDDALLRDIGQSREEAARESAKPAWRA